MNCIIIIGETVTKIGNNSSISKEKKYKKKNLDLQKDQLHPSFDKMIPVLF